MKYINKISALVCIFGFLASCQGLGVFQGEEENWEDTAVGEFGDQMVLSMNVAVPDLHVVNTKGVDPDGAGIKDMIFFCFDQDGTFIKLVQGNLTFKALGSEEGLVDVSVPNKTRIMHAICNLNLNAIAVDYAFDGMKEDELISKIESVSGLLLYWARIEVPANVKELYTEVPDADKRTEGEAIVDWLTIETNPTEKAHKGISGKGKPIVLLRNQARITVASSGASSIDGWDGTFFQITGYTVYGSQTYGTVAPYHPEKGYPTYCSTSFGLDQWSDETFITLPQDAELLTELMDVQQRNEVYVFESENTDLSPVDIIIKGRNITNGTAGEELYYKAQILDQERGLLPIRRNHHYRLEIIGNLYNGSASFAEAVEGAAANNIWLSISDEVRTVADDKFKLTVDEFQVVRNANEVAANNILNLGFNLESLGAQPVDVTKVRAAWVDESQNVADPMFETTYDPATGQGNIKLTLNAALADQVAEGTIIVSYGQLFRRITVKVTPEFEFTPVWASTEGKQGQQDHVTLVFNIPDNYPAELFPFDVLITTNELDANAHTGQKLTVVTVGEYGYGEKFTDIIDGKEVSHVGYKYVYKAAGPGMHRIYFQTLENQVLDGFDTYITIEAENFRRHNQHVVLSNVNYESYLAAESKYLFVPQKVNAPVNLNFSALNDVLTNGETVATPVAITSDNTFHLYTGNLAYTNDGAVSYTPVNEENWGTEGRVIEFHSLSGAADGKMSLNLRTLTPCSAEALYVASGDAETEFRSITFELLNYPEFGFNASVNGSTKELELSYDPDQEIEVSFDVTSFTATDGNDVDPFGTAFDIYIDAPTLILGDNPALSDKIEDLGNGRFVYHVDADRAVEATYGIGERKTIVFKPKAIATVGEITISSDQSKVIYLSQTMAIKNRAIVGTIKCGASEIAGHAVSFHRKSDNARIFSTTVREDGKYEFHVINEKISDWENEPIIVFAQKEGDYYTAEIADLKALFTSPDIILNL